MKKLLIHLLYTIVLILCGHQAHAAEDLLPGNKSFVVLIHSCNNKDWVKRNLDSVFTQSWDQFKVIYIDDASSDGTADLVEEYIQENALQQRISLIKNERPAGILSNVHSAAQLCSPDEILLILGGSDWLANRQVLAQLNTVYADPNVWFTYGQYCSYPDYARGDAAPISLSALENHPIRSRFDFKTCYARLLHQGKVEDPEATAPHQTLTMALLQLAGPHAMHIPEIHYIYNEQPRKKSDSLLTQSTPRKRIYISPGYWVQLFTLDNPIFNRDNCLDVMVQLRETARIAGYDILQANDLTSLQDFEYLIVFECFPEQLKQLDRYPKEKKVLFLWEPPSVLPENYRIDNHRDFSKVFTWHDELVDNKKYFKFYHPVLFPMIKDTVDFHSKKLCTLISSNKISSVPGELYSERRALINFFEQGHYPGFTLYGKWWPNYRVYGGTVDLKVNILKNFRFCFAYENIRNCPGYVTEKIFDCFQAGCVPVYWGASNICDYIPKGCFISREEFPDNETLYSWLRNMNEEQYHAYLKNIRTFLESEEADRFSIENFVSLFMQLITTPPSKDQP